MDTKYKIGDKIFAKVRGHSYWPAHITNIDNTKKLPKYNVSFYGTGETAVVNENNICLYLENKSIHGINKSKNNNFSKAMNEIELSFNKSTLLKKNKTKTYNNNQTLETKVSAGHSGYSIPTCSSPINIKHLLSPQPTEHNSLNKSMETMSEISQQSNIYEYDHNVTCNNSVNAESKISLSLSLMEGEWVTDDTIQTYYSFMETVIAKDLKVHLMNPVISQATKCLRDTRDLLSPLKLNEEKYIFVPINDSNGVSNTTSGTHWSLLVFSKATGKYYYFDSCGSYNYSAAEKTAKALNKVLGNDEKIVIETCTTPQQNNNKDCGIYLILITETLLAQLPSTETTNIQLFKIPNFSVFDVWTKRAQLASVVYGGNFFHSNIKLIMSPLIHPKIDINKRNEIGKDMPTFNDSTQPIHNNKGDQVHNYSSNEWEIVQRRRQVRKSKEVIECTPIALENRFQTLHQKEKTQNRENHRPTWLAGASKPKIKHSLKNKLGRKLRLNIFSDSQGRDLARLINKASDEEIDTVGTVMPNATLKCVTTAAEKSKTSRDVVLILGGSNNVLSNNVIPIFQSLERDLSKLSRNKIALISTVPTRYDRPLGDPIHVKIDLVNNYIRELVARNPSARLIELQGLKRFHFGKQGLHLNQRGKKKISYLIVKILRKEYLEDKGTEKMIWKDGLQGNKNLLHAESITFSPEILGNSADLKSRTTLISASSHSQESSGENGSTPTPLSMHEFPPLPTFSASEVNNGHFSDSVDDNTSSSTCVNNTCALHVSKNSINEHIENYSYTSCDNTFLG